MDWRRGDREANPESQQPQELPEGEELRRDWQPGLETIRTIQSSSDSVRAAQDYQLRGDSTEIATLTEALQGLESTRVGRPLADAIREHGTTVQFGRTALGALAEFAPETNEITISETLRDASPNVLSAYLAHEGTHVMSDKPDSIVQEYHAYKNQTETWENLKAEEVDTNLGAWADTIHRGELEAKREIRRRYADLPEYWD